MDEELLRFKQSDLREYAASVGFLLDRRESSRGTTVMRREPEKIIVSRKPDGVFTYWNVHDDDQDKGTILDFIQHRNPSLNLGAVRKILRAWLGSSPPAPLEFPVLHAVAKDLEDVRRRYHAMALAPNHPYLEEERRIPAATLQHCRFDGRVRVDQKGAAIFPHFDHENELCGYEIKNRGFTGFASGGRKGMWLSNSGPADRRLVVTESAIDALSHHVLVNDPHARYGSIGGKPKALQLEVVRCVSLSMPKGSEIVSAMDADDAGRELADLLENVFRQCGKDDLIFRREEPIGAKDWNDLLRTSKAPSLPVVRPAGPQIS